MHCITFAFSQCFMHLDVCFYARNLCAGRIGLGWAHNEFFFARHMLMHCSCIHTFSFSYLLCWLSLSFSLSLSLSDTLRMAPKRKTTPSWNPFHFEASSSNPTPLSIRFYDEKAHQDFSENFSKHGIHWNATWFYWTFPILLYPLSFTVRVGNLYVGYPWVVPLWSYRSFTPICMVLILLCLSFITSVRGTRVVVTSELISDVLHVPRVSHPDYPRCPCLRIVSKDDLLSHFCETPSSWGDHQNTSCSGFAKGSRFLNIVMTFVLHPLSHYNSIIEPCAWFLLSLIKDLTIDFLSDFILSLMDV